MTQEQLWAEIVRLRDCWLNYTNCPESGWPTTGVAIEGDFAGIQGYVLKPVPGARGAAKRLRGRSLQVSALTALIAQKITDITPGAQISTPREAVSCSGAQTPQN